MYTDNVPLKKQIVIGARIAPFINHKWGILNKFRLELSYMHNWFSDAEGNFGGPVGFFILAMALEQKPKKEQKR